jgi:two-component system, NtrC family, response regulator AlgB
MSLPAQHILTVDDDRVILQMYHEVLSEVPGYRLSQAQSGEEAWDLLQKETLPDLCILDVNMGDMSGLDLLARIRGVEALAPIPVIMCTTEGERPIVMQAVGLAAKSYIVKPFKPDHLLTLVAKALVS